MRRGKIVFVGDVHGQTETVCRGILAARPDGAVLLGDLELPVPLEQAFAPVLAAGIALSWIPGNHDSDPDLWYDHLFLSSLADRNLNARTDVVAGWRVAGLGGVFREKVWHPKAGDGMSRRATRQEFLQTINKSDRWRVGLMPDDGSDGLPRSHRTSIFWEDYERLWCLGERGERADVLVCHEAPSSHRHGFKVLDELAERLGCRYIVHGHHHENGLTILDNGTTVVGVGLATLWGAGGCWGEPGALLQGFLGRR